MTASFPSRVAASARDLASILLAAVVGGLGLVAAALGLLAVGRGFLLLAFWIALPIVTPGEVARVALPDGGAAWLRMGQGDPAVTTLYVDVPGRPTARWALTPLAGPGRPRLDVDAARGVLTVRRGDAAIATLAWRRPWFEEPGGRQAAAPDGLIDAWGRPTATPGREARTLAYWRAPAGVVPQRLAALGDAPLDLTTREPHPDDRAPGGAMVVLGLAAPLEALPGAREQGPLPTHGPYRGPAVWRVPARAVAAQLVTLDVLAMGDRFERVAAPPRSERAVSPTFEALKSGLSGIAGPSPATP